MLASYFVGLVCLGLATCLIVYSAYGFTVGESGRSVELFSRLSAYYVYVATIGAGAVLAHRYRGAGIVVVCLGVVMFALTKVDQELTRGPAGAAMLLGVQTLSLGLLLVRAPRG